MLTEEQLKASDLATQRIANVLLEAKKAFTIDLDPYKERLKSALFHEGNALRLANNFKAGVRSSLSSKALAVVMGALLAGGAASAYNVYDNKKKKKDYLNNPLLKYFSNISRVYSAGALGALAGLLANKGYSNLLNREV